MGPKKSASHGSGKKGENYLKKASSLMPIAKKDYEVSEQGGNAFFHTSVKGGGKRRKTLLGSLPRGGGSSGAEKEATS